MEELLSAPLVVQEEPQHDGKSLRNQLAATVKSINWSYAIFWSISSSHAVLRVTWEDGFYNEIETSGIASSLELTADQLILQRSEQLRELYEFLLSGRCEHHEAQPIASLSPENLGDMEWYYIISMTYTFRPGQGLPGRSFASNEHVWLCNAHIADSKTFPRALMAKSASIQTIVCIPRRGGVLELGTTASVPEDPELLNRAIRSFDEPNFTRCTEDRSTYKIKEANDVIMLDDLDQDPQDTVMAEGHDIGEVDCRFRNKLEQIIKEFNDLCNNGPWEELDMQPLQHSRWIMDDCSSLVETPLASKDDATLSTTGNCSQMTSFITWTRFQSDQRAVPVIGEPQKLLKKVVAGRPRTTIDNDGAITTRSTQESRMKNHVISERKRREKLNDMFMVLKSMLPTIRKMDKASILAETIAYLKDLKLKVEELESRREPIITSLNEQSERCQDSQITGNGKRVPARAKRKKGLQAQQ